MSTLEQKLNSILSESLRPTLEKVSSAGDVTNVSTLDLSNEESQGLVKIAAILRSANSEPTYSELNTFIGGLYGNR